jgi:hypothetical protein
MHSLKSELFPLTDPFPDVLLMEKVISQPLADKRHAPKY